MSQAGVLNINSSSTVINPSAGGTGLSSPAAHQLLITEGSSAMHLSGVGTAGQVMQSGGAGVDPAWSTATYPVSTTSQQILYSTATNTIGQLTTANSSLAATNSSGTLAMRALSVNIQTFTSTGTYTPTTGMLYCIIEAVGGGGGGGGSAATGASTTSFGSGGGAGEYARGHFSASTIGASQSVTIGSAGVSNSGAGGGNGGNTSVGSTLISANGGTGGTTPAAAAIVNSTGGAGGTGGTGGDVRYPGQPGGGAFGTGTTGPGLSGYGGTSIFGSGGGSIVANAAGSAGTGNGSGGSGGGSVASGGATGGGVGTKGIVVITEFIIN